MSFQCQSSNDALICFALKEEATPFQKNAVGQAGISILLTGIGPKNAQESVCSFLDHNSPKQIFTCGFAGGLNPDLATGTVVFATNDASLRDQLLAVGGKPARFLCAARVATTKGEKKALRRTTGADAVEMESEAIQAVCRERGIPCATVRAISDTVGEDLPLDFNALSNPDLSLNYGKLALALAKAPGKIPALMRLQKNCKFAAQRLAEVLQKVLALR